MLNNEAGRMCEHLRQVAAAMGVVVDDLQMEKFAAYYEFLLEYNQKVNLTRITEPLDVAVKHFGDSFFLLQPGMIPDGGPGPWTGGCAPRSRGDDPLLGQLQGRAQVCSPLTRG